MSDACRCGGLLDHFFEHALNCPLNPLRAEAIAEESELAALRAENTRLRKALEEIAEPHMISDPFYGDEPVCLWCNCYEHGPVCPAAIAAAALRPDGEVGG